MIILIKQQQGKQKYNILILHRLAMCKAAEANTAYQRGDYQLARIYNKQCKRYMKWAIIFCIVLLLFGIVMSMFSS